MNASLRRGSLKSSLHLRRLLRGHSLHLRRLLRRQPCSARVHVQLIPDATRGAGGRVSDSEVGEQDMPVYVVYLYVRMLRTLNWARVRFYVISRIIGPLLEHGFDECVASKRITEKQPASTSTASEAQPASTSTASGAQPASTSTASEAALLRACTRAADTRCDSWSGWACE
eukprot:TRINITY_DN5633_c0_g1_i1.p1 TRINITY_DN5633_c0_g1~~TRINITY_DN5633_c0_g1_i1.p1  ORF type:complete len:172 (+),score=0.45 TRINITY_DN5633_c0_g1_i1:304-819(+)